MSLQIFSKMIIISFAIGCLLTIVVLVCIEHMEKPIRPVYSVICVQNQGFIWLALRLENDQKFYEDFEKSTLVGSILYIWIMQLFSIICALLVHFFLKSLQNKISIHHFDKNSTLVTITFYYITDRELLKKLLIERIKKMITYLNSSVRRCITNIKKILTEIRSKDTLELIYYLLLKTVLLIRYLMVILLAVFFFGLLGFVAYTFYTVFNTAPSTDAFRYVFLLIALAYAFPLIGTVLVVAWFTMEFIAKLFKQVKYILSFLVMFIVYYCVISIALYFLESILPFNEVHEIYVLIGFVFFGFTSIRRITSLL